MSELKPRYNNNYSFILGMLCFGVVYLHSSWVGGFDIRTFGFENGGIARITGLFRMAIVPAFFILWGYLAQKYFYSSEGVMSFLKKKIVQFYPIFIFFFLINISYRLDYMSELPVWKILLGALGVFYESGLGGGGNIFIVVFFVMLTIAILKKINSTRSFIISYCILVLLITKILPHEVENCYMMYFGYYAGFFLGVLIKEFDFFDFNYSRAGLGGRIVLIGVLIIGFLTPLLNYFKIYFLEIQYNPNSPEQLFFCVLLLFFSNIVLNHFTFIKNGRLKLVKVIHGIGNNAYSHFIIQLHVIKLIVFVNTFILFNKVFVQLFVILFTSVISIFLVLPLYQRILNIIIDYFRLFLGLFDNKNSLGGI